MKTPTLIPRGVLVFSVALFLPLLPLTLWMHRGTVDVTWPSVEGRIVDVEFHRWHRGAGENGAPPRDNVDVRATAEYTVHDETYRRRLWTQTMEFNAYDDLEGLRLTFLGRPVTVEYDPDSPGEAPPICWRWWTAWMLTFACAACSVPWMLIGLQRLATAMDPRQPSRPRRALTASEYRARH